MPQQTGQRKRNEALINGAQRHYSMLEDKRQKKEEKKEKKEKMARALQVMLYSQALDGKRASLKVGARIMVSWI